MAEMKKMGVVGERDAVLAFKAVGMRVIDVSTAEETTAALHKLSTEGVPVIFITETMAELVPEALQKYKTMSGTAVIPIPGSQGVDGFGLGRVKANVEKAIGADILFNNKKEG
jgi:V/A-type H+/Na+-transporting ATPase subunit F